MAGEKIKPPLSQRDPRWAKLKNRKPTSEPGVATPPLEVQSAPVASTAPTRELTPDAIAAQMDLHKKRIEANKKAAETRKARLAAREAFRTQHSRAKPATDLPGPLDAKIEPPSIPAQATIEAIEKKHADPFRNKKTGRFSEGNAASQGRHLAEKKYGEIIGLSLKPEEWYRITRRAVDDALNGNRFAREWLSKYLIGDSRPLPGGMSGQGTTINVQAILMDPIATEKALELLDRLALVSSDKPAALAAQQPPAIEAETLGAGDIASV